MAFYSDIVKSAGAQQSTSALELPMQWANATYGPGWPIRPIQQPKDEDVSGIQIPRAIDFPMSANVSISPRTHYGLMPFSALADAFENVSEVKQCVNTLAREMCMFIPQLVDGDGNPVPDHDFNWLIEYPDRVTPYTVWLTRFLESMLVFDAPAVYVRKKNNYLDALEYVDGATLFLLVDEHGKPPTPPAPAFVQVIKGTPFGWYSQHEIWYRPTFRRYNAPYGMPPQEMQWVYVLILANIAAFALSWYREGNMPEGFFAAPEHWTLRQIDAYETALNARMSSGIAERRRARIFPHGFDWKATKSGEFPEHLYKNARNNLSLGHGIPPSEYGDAPGSGLGGKGFQDAAQLALYRMSLGPRKANIEGFYNEQLRRFGITDVHMELAFPSQSIDPEKQKNSVLQQVANGILSFNEARAALGYDPVDGGEIHLVVKQGTVTVLDAYFQQALAGTLQIPGAQPQGAPILQPGQTQSGQTEGKWVVPGTQGPLNIPVRGSSTNGQYATESGDSETFADASDLRRMADMIERGVGFPHPQYYSTPAHRNGHTNGNGNPVDAGRYGPLYAFQSNGRRPLMRHLRAWADARKQNKEARHQDGVMVALMLPPDVAAALSAQVLPMLPAGAEPAPLSEMHVTLAYLGTVEAGSRVRDAALAVLGVFAAKWPVLRGTIGGLGLFNSAEADGRVAFYATFDSPDLPAFRQDLIETLDAAGLWSQTGPHGFVPHITLAYIPTNAPLTIQPINSLPIAFDEVTFAFGGEYTPIPLGQGMAALAKHCGVCAGDELYYRAPIVNLAEIDMPWQGANDSKIVAMKPDGLPPRPAVWKPLAGEVEGLQDRVGGPMYPREEAGWLIDQSLGFSLVPVAYIAEYRDEPGAVLHYVDDRSPARDAEDYAQDWVARAAVFDFIMGQVDRGGHNWLTHPDEPDRPILIDNGLALPTFDREIVSAFVYTWSGKPLPPDCALGLSRLAGDEATWADVADLVGEDAVALARARANELMELGAMPVIERPVSEPSSPSPTSPGPEDPSTPADAVSALAKFNPFHHVRTGLFGGGIRTAQHVLAGNAPGRIGPAAKRRARASAPKISPTLAPQMPPGLKAEAPAGASDGVDKSTPSTASAKNANAGVDTIPDPGPTPQGEVPNNEPKQ